jgi:hypothetical protein
LAITSHHAHSDSTEVARALERGLSLADALGDAEYHLELLAGLNLYGTRFSDADAPLAVAERYAAVATSLGKPKALVTADWMLGSSHHLVGDQASAQRFYESGFERALASGVIDVRSFGYDHRVRALIGYARTLWLRGLPDLAAGIAHEGIEFAGRNTQPVSLALCLAHATPVFLWRGDLDVAEGLTERLIAHANRYSLESYHAAGLGLRGELMMARGDIEPGIESLRLALPVLQAQRRYLFSSACSRALAEALARSGHALEATIIIDAILADATRYSGTFEVPGLMLTRAEVLLAASPSSWLEAEAALMGSIELARRQSARGWELRSAIVLSRWWKDRERQDEARTLLRDVYARFSEGFDTADLREAARLLDEFEDGPQRRKRGSRLRAREGS